ncbi:MULTISPECIES: element excision factor XisI family protein [Nostocales]|uniref:XisI protein n=3 Tax=Nostocales TaxID=1161 RepID=A0A8S9ST19_9CYAN|nr:element excision factor XisI family protein [Tolypothrix bouteillei]KAF3883740.1 XisI protein [Tolypothrix bouteillei VB521301]
MEKLNYCDLVEKRLKQYATITMGEGTEIEFITKRSNGHYLVMFIGWRDEVQVYGSLIHIDTLTPIQYSQTDPPTNL